MKMKEHMMKNALIFEDIFKLLSSEMPIRRQGHILYSMCLDRKKCTCIHTLIASVA